MSSLILSIPSRAPMSLVFSPLAVAEGDSAPRRGTRLLTEQNRHLLAKTPSEMDSFASPSLYR